MPETTTNRKTAHLTIIAEIKTLIAEHDKACKGLDKWLDEGINVRKLEPRALADAAIAVQGDLGKTLRARLESLCRKL